VGGTDHLSHLYPGKENWGVGCQIFLGALAVSTQLKRACAQEKVWASSSQ